MAAMTFPELVAAELAEARREHPPVDSLHHYHSVLLEELEEFWREVQAKPGYRCKARLLAELVQVGAMAQRAAEDMRLVDGPEIMATATVLEVPDKPDAIFDTAVADEEHVICCLGQAGG